MQKKGSLPHVIVVAGRITDGFMTDDLNLLAECVKPVPFELARWRSRRGKLWAVARALYNAGFFIYQLVGLNARVVIFWFASVNYGPLLGGIARLLRRQVIVITGGRDCIYLPEEAWGDLKSGWNRLSFRILMRLANSVLPFSDSSRAVIARGYHPRRMITVYPAVDTEFFTPDSNLRQARVTTCCYNYDRAAIKHKGLDIFIETARQVPEVEFVLTGDAVDQAAKNLQKNAPPNVTFLARLRERTGYRDLLRSSSVYAQLSAHEGFGVSLAEAMACGCIPVVSDRYSLPEVVGPCGFAVPYGDCDATAAAAKKALALEPAERQEARTRVVTKFDKRVRQKLFFEEMGPFLPELCHAGPDSSGRSHTAPDAGRGTAGELQ